MMKAQFIDELEKVKNFLKEGQFRDLELRIASGSSSAPERLTAVTGQYRGRVVNLDFLPWKENLYIKVLDLSLSSNFEMTIEKKEGESRLTPVKTRLPLTEMECENQGIWTKYQALATHLPGVEDFIRNSEDLKLLSQLEDFERLKVDLRYLRVYRIFNLEDDLSAESTIREIEILDQLAENIEKI